MQGLKWQIHIRETLGPQSPAKVEQELRGALIQRWPPYQDSWLRRAEQPEIGLEVHVQQGKTLQDNQPLGKACLYTWERVMTKVRKNVIGPKIFLTCNPCHNSEARPWGGFGRAIAIEEEWHVILEIVKWPKGWALDIWISFGMSNGHCMGCISTIIWCDQLVS